MRASNITQKCQKAARAYLIAEELSFISFDEEQIVAGICSRELSLPAVIVQCASADAAVPWEGNWSALLRVEIRSQADDSDPDGDTHLEMAGELFEKFMVSIEDGRGLMSSEGIGFTCQQLLPVRQGWEINDGSWVSFLELRVECAGTFFDVT